MFPLPLLGEGKTMNPGNIPSPSAGGEGWSEADKKRPYI
jgi:hypothetical protein